MSVWMQTKWAYLPKITTDGALLCTKSSEEIKAEKYDKGKWGTESQRIRCPSWVITCKGRNALWECLAGAPFVHSSIDYNSPHEVQIMHLYLLHLHGCCPGQNWRIHSLIAPGMFRKYNAINQFGLRTNWLSSCKVSKLEIKQLRHSARWTFNL